MEHHESFWADPRSYVAIAFVIFFIIFGKKIWSALTAILDKRVDAIRTELAEASRLRQEAETMLRDAQSRRDAALAEATALLEGAKAEALRVAERAMRDAEAAAKRREQMAMDRISAAEKAAVRDVQVAAVEVATEAVKGLLSTDLSAERDGALIDRAISGLPNALAPRRAA